jgi:hypothetical protein
MKYPEVSNELVRVRDFSWLERDRGSPEVLELPEADLGAASFYFYEGSIFF